MGKIRRESKGSPPGLENDKRKQKASAKRRSKKGGTGNTQNSGGGDSAGLSTKKITNARDPENRSSQKKKTPGCESKKRGGKGEKGKSPAVSGGQRGETVPAGEPCSKITTKKQSVRKKKK